MDTQTVIKKIFHFLLSYYVRIINLSLNDLKLAAKSRNIKNYENKFKNDLMKIVSEPKTKINLSKNKIKEVKKDFSKLRYRFSKSQIAYFRRSLYNIKIQKSLSTLEVKETQKNLLELEKVFLVSRSIMIMMTSNTEEVALNKTDKNYYKPIKTKSAFNGNYT